MKKQALPVKLFKKNTHTHTHSRVLADGFGGIFTEIQLIFD